MTKAVEPEQLRTDSSGAAGTQPGWQQRLAAMRSAAAPRLASVKSVLAPRPAAARPAAATQQGGRMRGTFKFVFGMIVFILGAESIAGLLINLDYTRKLKLEDIRFAPPNTPLLGGVTGLLLIQLLAVLALWLVLRRFNIIPKDLYGMTNTPAARRSSQPQTTTLRAGPPRTRAERRHAAEAAAVPPATKSAAKNSTKNTAKGSSGANTTSARVRTVTQSRSSSVSGDHDEAYERIRAADRARRRRAARR